MRYYYSIFKWQVTGNKYSSILAGNTGSGRPTYIYIYIYIYTHLFSSSLKLRRSDYAASITRMICK